MFNPGVLSFCVFTNEDGIDIIIRSLESFYRDTWANVRKQIEGSSESEVE